MLRLGRERERNGNGDGDRLARAIHGGMGATLSPEKDFGSLYGEENRCPHCGALARVDKDDDLRWVCGVCGGPRVPAKVKIGEDGNAALRDAAKSRRSASGWRVASWALGFGAAMALVAAIVVGFGSVLVGGGLVLAGVLMAIVSATFSRSARSARLRARADVDRAWEHAIGALLEAGTTNATAKSIAKTLGVTEAEVEVALSTLSAQGRTRVDIGNDADLVYRAENPDVAPIEEEPEEKSAKKQAES